MKPMICSAKKFAQLVEARYSRDVRIKLGLITQDSIYNALFRQENPISSLGVNDVTCNTMAIVVAYTRIYLTHKGDHP